MEITDRTPSRKQVCPDEFPSLLKHTAAEAVVSLDSVPNKSQSSLASDPCASPLRNQVVGSQITSSVKESESVDVGEQVHVHVYHHTHSISISMPSCPTGVKTVELDGAVSEKEIVYTSYDHRANSSQHPKQLFFSQPIPANIVQINGSVSQNDKCFDPFKTWSGRLERQISNLRGKPQEPPSDPTDFSTNEIQVLPVDRYFDALEGPELDTLKASEVPVLPKDTHWPFLLRFPISSYGICLGLGSQAILWKTLATSPSISFLRVNLKFNLILWCISLALLVLVSSIYLLKIVFYFEAVKREYHHPVRVNFFFAPWIACLFLAIGVPPSIAGKLQAPLWYVMMAPILCLELKIYGQWMSGGQRRLSKVANPSNHLSIVGNFVGALLGASMGLREGPIFFFAIGLAHYTVLFVTLYQRLPTNETLPKELHPVFFLFVAVPSVACMAWARIREDFDYGSRIAYFTALFLYVSLAVRINFFRGFRFSLAWWAYTFPMTGASIATIRYSMEMKNLFTQSLSVALTAISTFMVSALLVSTVVHAFVLRDLFPNDVSIAISEKRLKSRKKHWHRRSGSSDEKEHGDAGSPDSLRSQLSV